MTLRWIGPGKKRYDCHCDSVFVSQDLAAAISGVAVGSMETWVESKLSDHCPVLADFAI